MLLFYIRSVNSWGCVGGLWCPTFLHLIWNILKMRQIRHRLEHALFPWWQFYVLRYKFTCCVHGNVMNPFFILFSSVSILFISFSLLSPGLSLFHLLPSLNFVFPSLLSRAYSWHREGMFIAHNPRKHEIVILITAVTELSCASLRIHFMRLQSGRISARGKITCSCVVCEEMHLTILVLSARFNTRLWKFFTGCEETEKQRRPLSFIIIGRGSTMKQNKRCCPDICGLWCLWLMFICSCRELCDNVLVWFLAGRWMRWLIPLVSVVNMTTFTCGWLFS